MTLTDDEREFLRAWLIHPRPPSARVIAERLRRQIERAGAANGLNVWNVCTVAGVSSALQAWMNRSAVAGVMLSYKSLERVAGAFGLSPWEFYRGDAQRFVIQQSTEAGEWLLARMAQREMVSVLKNVRRGCTPREALRRSRAA